MFENISADFKRFSKGKFSTRALVRGLLSQGFQAILVYRFFHWLREKNIPAQPFRFILERFIEITTGISIPAECKIGKGLRIHHFGGIIFHPSTEIGDNCTIYHEVTIGDTGGYGRAANIGNNVLIGAGAKIIGEIMIGNNCIIGANAVVTKDMPEDCVAFGNPCQFRERSLIEKDAKTENAQSKPIHVMDLRGTYKGGGGPDKTILNTAVQHDCSRVNVVVTYLRNPNDEEFDIHIKASSLGINYVDVYDKKLLDFSCLAGLKSLIKQHGITIIHAHDDKTLLYGWLLKLYDSRLRIMYTCHSHSCYSRNDFHNLISYYKYSIRERSKIFLMKRFSKPIITVSEDTRKRLIKNGISPNDVEVLYNGIDTEYWKKDKGKSVLKEELAAPLNGHLVGTVARITYDKDLATFYEVARTVSSQVDHVIFVIVGDGYGSELEEARNKVTQLGLEDIVKFTGHRNDLFDVYSSFDLFLMTSLTEGLPNTVLEAMVLSIPVVSTSVGGVAELVVHNETGFLSNKGDVNSLSQHVINLLKNEQKMFEFGIAARQRIEKHFSFSQRVKKMEEYYERFNNNCNGKPVTSIHDSV